MKKKSFPLSSWLLPLLTGEGAGIFKIITVLPLLRIALLVDFSFKETDLSVGLKVKKSFLFFSFGIGLA